MATKCQNGMKVKSKSESCQNRTKRPAKYRSMTLRRQEAKLDVTTTGTPEASFLYDTGNLFLLCYKKRIGLHIFDASSEKDGGIKKD